MVAKIQVVNCPLRATKPHNSQYYGAVGVGLATLLRVPGTSGNNSIALIVALAACSSDICTFHRGHRCLK